MDPVTSASIHSTPWKWATLTRWLPSFTKQAPPSSSRLTGNLRRASALSEESFSLYERSGDKAGMALALINLGDVVRERGDEKRAAALINDALSLHRELGNERGIAHALDRLSRMR